MSCDIPFDALSTLAWISSFVVLIVSFSVSVLAARSAAEVVMLSWIAMLCCITSSTFCRIDALFSLLADIICSADSLEACLAPSIPVDTDVVIAPIPSEMSCDIPFDAPSTFAWISSFVVLSVSVRASALTARSEAEVFILSWIVSHICAICCLSCSELLNVDSWIVLNESLTTVDKCSVFDANVLFNSLAFSIACFLELSFKLIISFDRPLNNSIVFCCRAPTNSVCFVNSFWTRSYVWLTVSLIWLVVLLIFLLSVSSEWVSCCSTWSWLFDKEFNNLDVLFSHWAFDCSEMVVIVSVSFFSSWSITKLLSLNILTDTYTRSIIDINSIRIYAHKGKLPIPIVALNIATSNRNVILRMLYFIF